MKYVQLCMKIIKRHRKRKSSEINFIEFFDFLREVNICPKLISYSFSYHLFTKLVPTYAKSKIESRKFEIGT